MDPTPESLRKSIESRMQLLELQISSMKSGMRFLPPDELSPLHMVNEMLKDINHKVNEIRSKLEI